MCDEFSGFFLFQSDIQYNMHQDIYKFLPPPTFYLSYIPGWESGSHVQTCRLLLNAGRMENLIPISAFQTHCKNALSLCTCKKCTFPSNLQKMHFSFGRTKLHKFDSIISLWEKCEVRRNGIDSEKARRIQN